MTCAAARNLIHAFLDGELDVVRHLEIEHHLQDCKSCSEIHESHVSLRAALRSDALYHRAPVGLRERVVASLEPSDRATRRRPVPWRWIGLAAAAACLAVVSWGVGHYGVGAWARNAQPSSEDRLADAVLTSHVRSLMAEHLFDIPSSDQHTVKPWFTGKLDFSPAVHDLAQDAYPLAGGRLDYLADRPVAALVYQRRKHVINLFLWPSPRQTDIAPDLTSRQGYHLVHWVQAGMTYWAVSDLNERELLEFAQLVRDQGASR